MVDNPDSGFAKFCQAKYLLVVHPKMEEAFFGNLDGQTFIMCGKHPRTEFYQVFAKMAKWLWVLIGSAVSIDPDETLFTVYCEQRSMFSSLHMESVEERRVLVFQMKNERRTEFMIMPGFKSGQTMDNINPEV
ncbi:unnamed protein product [Lupinus luteus]|uniref:GIL1/IRKI C-terminal domain-containing protein n=1 Tax=Lupinus luteus TaxID=3873 RepID=A0AAV1WEI9_LUPLU